MPSRLAIFCDHVLEMSWLAALITAPLFFNVYSSRVFEPDKIVLVRSLALIMAGAWLVKIIDRAFRGLSFRGWVRDNPLVLPTLGVVLTTFLSTLTSVAPHISLWGSYQRLQGLYSTLAYVTIFFIAASTLRTRAQLERAINVILLVGFPIAYYGLMQHYLLDPLPWGGDVTTRIAANMGNSIFVAAYLIMIVPFALARWIETLGRLTSKNSARAGVIGIVSVALIALAVVWAVDFTAGALLAATIVLGLFIYALARQRSRRDALLVAVYTINLAALFVAIFFTQSRGPWLGLAGALFTFAVVFGLVRGARRFIFGSIALTAVAALFLAIFNLSASPLEPFKELPYVGRLGRLLETDSGTGRVRELIWEGAVQMILPHAPIWSPVTGEDAFNAFRPLIGYGPEAMYVAYNSFYPSELAHLEARNASPDRSHNETFDALTMTGFLGFATYILMFAAVFYFGLKSLGMAQSKNHRNLFIALWLGAGFLSAIIFALWRGWNYVGVALPFGMIFGFFAYLVWDALRRPPALDSAGAYRTLWTTALLSAFIAHFIEINFGIAIVSTRTYFWFYSALLVVLGMNRVTLTESLTSPPSERVQKNSVVRSSARSRKQERARTTITKTPQDSLSSTLAWTLLTALVLITLAFDFVNNQSGSSNALDALWRSLFSKRGDPAYAVFSLFLLTWLFAGILGFDSRLRGESRWLALAIFGVLSFTVAMWFVLFQTRWLTNLGADPTEGFRNLLLLYFAVLFLLVIASALSLASETPRSTTPFAHLGANVVFAPFLTLLLITATFTTNYTPIAADILYKAGTNFEAVGAWDRGVDAYERAMRLQPAQDFYLLFLGRAYLEGGRNAPDPKLRADSLRASEQRLLSARQLNPLNTDHSANLARLNRIWASVSVDPVDKAARLQKSFDYYHDATRLSPNTAHLYNEWSQAYFLGGNLEKAREMLQRSLDLDAEFPQTYLYLADYHLFIGDNSAAVENYLRVISLDAGILNTPDGVPLAGAMQLLAQPGTAPRAIRAYSGYRSKNPESLAPYYGLAEIYKRLGQNDRAREQMEAALALKPNDLMAHLAYVNFLSTTGQIDGAESAMRRLLDRVPKNSPESVSYQEFHAQLQNLQRAIQAVRNAPNDLGARRLLATLWRARGQPQFALLEYQAVARLAPEDYDAAKNIALLNLVLNQTDDAQRAIAAAASLAPDKEKPIWQNLLSALNNQKTLQWDRALRDAQAALALAADGDKPTLQTYVNQLQAQVQAVPR